MKQVNDYTGKNRINDHQNMIPNNIFWNGLKNDIKLIKTELETRSLEKWLKVNNNIRYEDDVKLP